MGTTFNLIKNVVASDVLRSGRYCARDADQGIPWLLRKGIRVSASKKLYNPKERIIAK